MNRLYEYKLALKLNKDINKILLILTDSLSQLETYKHFATVKSCITTMNDAKILLELHNHTQAKIIKNKGLIE